MSTAEGWHVCLSTLGARELLCSSALFQRRQAHSPAAGAQSAACSCVYPVRPTAPAPPTNAHQLQFHTPHWSLGRWSRHAWCVWSATTASWRGCTWQSSCPRACAHPCRAWAPLTRRCLRHGPRCTRRRAGRRTACCCRMHTGALAAPCVTHRPGSYTSTVLLASSCRQPKHRVMTPINTSDEYQKTASLPCFRPRTTHNCFLA